MSLSKLFLGLTASAFFLGANAVNAQPSYDSVFIQAELERVVSDPENSVTISVDAPVDYVFRFLMERLDLYTNDAETITFDNSAGKGIKAAGTERITTMKEGGTLVQRFLIMEPTSTYAYFTDISKSTLSVPLKYSLAKYEFTEIDVNKTAVKISVVYQPSSRLTGFIVRRLFNSAFERDFNNAARIMSERYQGELNDSS
ncbi:MAG: hypothetical protein ACJA2Q_000187 [Pseudohongiellaceae bacterium]|jgi:hypothetical protein